MRVLIAALLVVCGSALSAERPNFVLCMTDDQGWGDVGYNGLKAVETPNLDAMAAAGLRFNRFYAAAPVCSPTRGSFLTGRHPNRYGTFSHGYKIRAQEITIAQLAKTAGYSTGHFGKWHLNGIRGPGKPIAADDPLHPGKFGFDEWLSVTNFFDLNPQMSRNGETVQLQGDSSDATVDEALKFIAARAAEKKPFLAVVWFGNPHSPHLPLEEDKARAKGSLYYGEIAGIDRSMGKLRGELRKLNIAENTLLLFCSDNGAARPGSTGNLRGFKGSVWEGGVRVPGIIEWPAVIKEPRQTDVPVVTSDILPTLAEIIGITPDPRRPLDGISILPLIAGNPLQRPAPIAFWEYANNERDMHRHTALDLTRHHAALTESRYKLHKIGAEKYELYDLIDDPREQTDISAQHPEIVEKMKAALGQWQQSVARSYLGEDYK